MNKRELICKVSEKTGLYQNVAETYIDAVMESITDALVIGDVVKIKGFGRFVVKDRKARIGRNPKNPQDTYELPPKKSVVFTAGKKLKEAINK